MKIRKELWFGFSLMAIILVTVIIFTPWAGFIDGHLTHDDLGALGLLMLALVVVAIMLGFPDRLHADGHGRVLRLARLPQRQPGAGHDADPRPDGAARLLGHVERRADRDPALRLHGLPGRAREPDREALQEPAPGAGARARRAGRRDDRDLRDLRDRHRHRRRRRHADGPARAPGDAAGRLQRAAVGGRDHRRRLPRHPDPAVGAADRVRRDGRRVGGQALRRRVLPRHHAGRAVRRSTSSSSPS